MTTFASFVDLDQQLASRGFPPCSRWWLGEIKRFYSGKVRNWTARVGRGGSKSTVLAKIALHEVIAGKFDVPAGEVHFFAIVSVSRDEAAQRIGQISSMLTALGVEHSRTGETITLERAPRGIRVLTCSIAGTSGFRCFGFGCDELAKWRNADDSANPAAEVVASLRACTVTHRGARRLLFSSPLSSSDFHSAAVSAGESPSAIVSEAPTWIATDKRITEAQTRELEPDERVWLREYAAIPQSAALAAFDPADVAAAFVARSDLGRAYRCVGVIDASSGRKDRFTFGFAGWRESARGMMLVFDAIGDFAPRDVRQLGVGECVRQICELARQRGVHTVLGDQRESAALKAIFRQHNVALREMTWTASSKPRAVARVRRWLLEQRLAIPPDHDRTRHELLSFEERVNTSGDFTFGARGSGHDDFVALLLTAALGDEAGALAGSPQFGAPTGASAGGRKILPRSPDHPSTENSPLLAALWSGARHSFIDRDGQIYLDAPRRRASQIDPHRSSRLTFRGGY